MSDIAYDGKTMVEVVVEIIDGQIYLSHNIDADYIYVTVYDYDTAEKVSVEDARAHTAEVSEGRSAIDGAHKAWAEYEHERSMPLDV